MPETLLKDRLTEFRLARKLRQKEVAAMLDVPFSTYRTWEKGKQTPEKLKLAEVIRRIEAEERKS